MSITYRVLRDYEVVSAGDWRDMALAAELRALSLSPAESLAVRIEETLRTSAKVIDIDDAYELEVLARALDHRRNAETSSHETPDDDRAFPRAHVTLRDHLISRLGYKPITYRLAGTWEQPSPELWSYTGVYAEGARIVTRNGAWKAVRVVEGGRGEPGSIVVEPWHDE